MPQTDDRDEDDEFMHDESDMRETYKEGVLVSFCLPRCVARRWQMGVAGHSAEPVLGPTLQAAHLPLRQTSWTKTERDASA